MKITLLSSLILLGCGADHLDDRESLNMPVKVDSVASLPSPDAEECVDWEIKTTKNLRDRKILECPSQQLLDL